MGTKEIINEIQRLPINKRMLIIERTLKSIRESELKKGIDEAVNELFVEYKTDKDLTAFTNLDFENFYEAR